MPTPYAGINNFPATIPLADDTDPPNASVFQPPQEGLADRTVWLKTRVGLTFDTFRVSQDIDDIAFGTRGSWTDTPSPLPDTNGVLLTSLAMGDFAVNDIVRVMLTGTMLVNVTTPPAFGGISLFYKGANGNATYAKIPGALTALTSLTAGTDGSSFALMGHIVISSIASNVDIAISGWISSAAATAVSFVGSYALDIIGVRNT